VGRACALSNWQPFPLAYYCRRNWIVLALIPRISWYTMRKRHPLCAILIIDNLQKLMPSPICCWGSCKADGLNAHAVVTLEHHSRKQSGRSRDISIIRHRVNQGYKGATFPPTRYVGMHRTVIPKCNIKRLNGTVTEPLGWLLSLQC